MYLALVILLYVFKLAQPSEGPKELELLQSANSVPMMGKRMPLRLMPSFTSGFLVPGPQRSRFIKKNADARTNESSGRAMSDTRSGYRPSWQFGKREDAREEEEKRSPWTGSWANVVWRPDLTRPSQDKRSPWNANWATVWPPRFTAVGPGKRSPLPRSWSSGPQSFRYHASSPEWLSRDLMFKRMNDVPMMGKRDPELSMASDNREDNSDYMEAVL